MRTIVIIAAAALVAAGLGGCVEEPQRLVSTGEAGHNTDARDDQLRERTLRQGESGRIYH